KHGAARRSHFTVVDQTLGTCGECRAQYGAKQDQFSHGSMVTRTPSPFVTASAWNFDRSYSLSRPLAGNVNCAPAASSRTRLAFSSSIWTIPVFAVPFALYPCTEKLRAKSWFADRFTGVPEVATVTIPSAVIG